MQGYVLSPRNNPGSRRQTIALIASRAYGFGRQVARVPENAELATHLEEIKRLRKLASRKKRTSAKKPPAPAPVTLRTADTTETPKA